MKIEHLTNTDSDHPKSNMIRAFDFDSWEACRFRDILSGLANGAISEIDLTGLPFVTTIGGCRLILKVGKGDMGTIQLSKTVFECVLTKVSWETAEDRVAPFCDGDLSGYQWLYKLNTNIEFLFSPSGEW